MDRYALARDPRERTALVVTDWRFDARDFPSPFLIEVVHRERSLLFVVDRDGVYGGVTVTNVRAPTPLVSEAQVDALRSSNSLPGAAKPFNATVIEESPFGRVAGQMLVNWVLSGPQASPQAFDAAMRLAELVEGVRFEKDAPDRALVRLFARACSLVPNSADYVPEVGADLWKPLSAHHAEQQASGDCEDLALTFLQYWAAFARHLAALDGWATEVISDWIPGLAVSSLVSGTSHVTGVVCHKSSFDSEEPEQPPMIVELTAFHPIDYSAPDEPFRPIANAANTEGGHTRRYIRDVERRGVYRDSVMLLLDPARFADSWGEFAILNTPATLAWAMGEEEAKLEATRHESTTAEVRAALSAFRAPGLMLAPPTLGMFEHDLDPAEWRVTWIGRRRPYLLAHPRRVRVVRLDVGAVTVFALAQREDRAFSGGPVAAQHFPGLLTPTRARHVLGELQRESPLVTDFFSPGPGASYIWAASVCGLHEQAPRDRDLIYPAWREGRWIALANRDVPSGVVVGVLYGDVIERTRRSKPARRAPVSWSDDSLRHFVFRKFVLDQTVRGGKTAFVRRLYGSDAAEANCKAVLLPKNIPALVATRDVTLGDELLCA